MDDQSTPRDPYPPARILRALVSPLVFAYVAGACLFGLLQDRTGVEA